MKYAAVLPYALLASWSAGIHAYGALPFKATACGRPHWSRVRAASSDRPQNDLRPKNIVDTGTFVAAIEELQSEFADADGSKGATWNTSDAKDKAPAYAIGKLLVSLPIDSDPGLDLTESTGLVLVSAVSKKAAATGIEPFDTIVGVSAAGTFQENTKALDLEGTARILLAASARALENGLTEIELELNRLIKLQYAE